MAKRGRIFQRTIRGGWEKVRGDATRQEFKRYYSRKHKIGSVKGKPMYSFRPNKR